MAVLVIFFFFVSLLYATITGLFSVHWKRCPVFHIGTGSNHNESGNNQAETRRNEAETLNNQAETRQNEAETLNNQAETRRNEAETLNNQVKISVVIPFRNESETLPKCLDSITAQCFPQTNFEVILSDDLSTDGSGAYAREYCRLHKGFRYCPPTDKRSGKKTALLRGIRMAKNELIVLTDADCTADKRWLETIAAFYAAERPDMMVGLVDMDADGGWMAAFQELEFLSLTGIAAGAAAMGRSLYCSSANLAFTRSLFEEYPDPLRMNIASGDDTFFLHQVKRDGHKRIRLLKSRHAVVTTKGAMSFGDFLNQRIRWASKGIHYRDADTLAVACVTLLINLALLVSLVLFLCFRSLWVFPSLFLIKTVADLTFMKDILQFFGKKSPSVWFPVYELVYMVYVPVVAILGFTGRFRWK